MSLLVECLIASSIGLVGTVAVYVIIYVVRKKKK